MINEFFFKEKLEIVSFQKHVVFLARQPIFFFFLPFSLLAFIFYFLCSESWMSFTSLIKEYFVFMLWCMTVFYFLFSLLWCMTVLYFCRVIDDNRSLIDAPFFLFLLFVVFVCFANWWHGFVWFLCCTFSKSLLFSSA